MLTNFFTARAALEDPPPLERFKSHLDVTLGDMGQCGSAGGTVGLSDLRALFLPK